MSSAPTGRASERGSWEIRVPKTCPRWHFCCHPMTKRRLIRRTAPKLTLRLKPLGEGTLTKLVLSGPIYSVPPATELRSLFGLLEQWHGRFVDVALSVDGTSAGARWAETWEHRLAVLPARLQRVRFVIRRVRLLRDGDNDV
jgi:hypothetical protein